MRILPPANNFLMRQERTSLVVVRVDPQGAPDSVSYWQAPAPDKTTYVCKSYKVGILVDIIV